MWRGNLLQKYAFPTFPTHHNQTENVLVFPFFLWKDPAIAITKRINGAYESYDRGTQAEAWITEADGKTPLVGEVNYGYNIEKLKTVITSDNIWSALFCPPI